MTQEKLTRCILNDPEKVLVGKQEKGEPPGWVPSFAYPNAIVVWLDAPEFEELKKRRWDEPCDICPEQVKERCEHATK